MGITRLAPNISGIIHLGNIRLFLYNYLWAKNNNAEIHLRLDNIIEEDGGVIRSLEEEQDLFDYILNIFKKIGFEFSNIYRMSDCVIEATSHPQWDVMLMDAIFPIFYDWSDNLNKYLKVKYKTKMAIAYYGIYSDFKYKITRVFRGNDLLDRTIAEEKMKTWFPLFKNYERNFFHLPLLLNEEGQAMHKTLKNAPTIETLENKGLTINQILSYLFFSGIEEKEKYEIKSYSLEDLQNIFKKVILNRYNTQYNEKEALKWQFGK